MREELDQALDNPGRSFLDYPVSAFLGHPAGDIAADALTLLTRGSAQLTVRWPSSQADACATWLRELVSTALK